MYPGGRKKTEKSAEGTRKPVSDNTADTAERGGFEAVRDCAQGDLDRDTVSGVEKGSEAGVLSSEERNTGMDVSSGEERSAGMDVISGAEVTSQVLTEWLEGLKEKLNSFESEGIDELLDIMENCQYDGTLLSILTKEIREKVDEFDFLGASDVLSGWEAEHPIG